MTEIEERQLVVREAQTWIGTPYVTNADIKGAGVDCGMLLARVFVDVGLVPAFDPRPYPAQWHLHQKAERYLAIVERFARLIDGPPKAGDISMSRIGHCWAHGCIVVDWPEVIHANGPRGCVLDSFARNLKLDSLPKRFYSIWPRGATIE